MSKYLYIFELIMCFFFQLILLVYHLTCSPALPACFVVVFRGTNLDFVLLMYFSQCKFRTIVEPFSKKSQSQHLRVDVLFVRSLGFLNLMLYGNIFVYCSPLFALYGLYGTLNFPHPYFFTIRRCAIVVLFCNRPNIVAGSDE